MSLNDAIDGDCLTHRRNLPTETVVDEFRRLPGGTDGFLHLAFGIVQ